MKPIRVLLICAAAAWLAGCASPPADDAARTRWNGGVWNSVLGYHGPANVLVAD